MSKWQMWICDGYAEDAGQCSRSVGEDRIFTDVDDNAVGAPLVLCKEHEAAAVADGVELILHAERFAE